MCRLVDAWVRNRRQNIFNRGVDSNNTRSRTLPKIYLFYDTVKIFIIFCHFSVQNSVSANHIFSIHAEQFDWKSTKQAKHEF